MMAYAPPGHGDSGIEHGIPAGVHGAKVHGILISQSILERDAPTI